MGGLGLGIKCRNIGNSRISLGIASSAILRDSLFNRVCGASDIGFPFGVRGWR